LIKLLNILHSYLLDNHSLVQGRRVLDVGSGCGASAIAAKMAGAINVIANDIDQGKIHTGWAKSNTTNNFFDFFSVCITVTSYISNIYILDDTG